MAAWALAGTINGDEVTIVATGPDGQDLRFTAWKSHLTALTAAQRRAYLIARIKELTASPAATTTEIPATVDVV